MCDASQSDAQTRKCYLNFKISLRYVISSITLAKQILQNLPFLSGLKFAMSQMKSSKCKQWFKNKDSNDLQKDTSAMVVDRLCAHLT